MRTLIQNGRVIAPNGILENGFVLLDGEKIAAVGAGSYAGAVDKTVDASGAYVSAGFIDMHTHGAGGHDFMDGTVEAYEQAAKAHMAHGTTSLVPTTLTCTNEELLHTFRTFKEAKATMVGGPNLLGLHLEGPFFSPEQAGAQDPSYMQIPTPEAIAAILDGSDDIIRMSADPSLEGGIALGDVLKCRGIVASVAHSNAEYHTVMEAAEHGYTLLTHFYSGMSMLHRIGPYRHLGVVEAGYMNDALDIEIIADGKHLPKELLEFIVRFKPLDQISLVTDSMRGAGLPDGSIVKLGSLTLGQDVLIEDGVAILFDRTAFAGSVCTADRCIRTMHKTVGLDIATTVSMMTANPARVLGIGDRKGSLAVGFDADIVLFDDDINIKSVFVMGNQTV